MKLCWSRWLLTLTGLAWAAVGHSQTPPSSAFLAGLPFNEVTESDGQIYVRLRDQRRGASQALERQLIGRATVLAGHWLCKFTPKPNQRLETNLQGVNLIYSAEVDGILDVVIRLKKQKPDCIVQPRDSTDPKPLAGSAPRVLDAQVEGGTTNVENPMEQKSPQAIMKIDSTEPEFKVRIYSTER